VLELHQFELVRVVVVVTLVELAGQVDLLANHALQHEVVRASGNCAVKGDIVLPGVQPSAQDSEVLRLIRCAALAGELCNLDFQQRPRFKNVGYRCDLDLRSPDLLLFLGVGVA